MASVAEKSPPTPSCPLAIPTTPLLFTPNKLLPDDLPSTAIFVSPSDLPWIATPLVWLLTAEMDCVSPLFVKVDSLDVADGDTPAPTLPLLPRVLL